MTLLGNVAKEPLDAFNDIFSVLKAFNAYKKKEVPVVETF